MKVLVGSKNEVKVAAVQQAFAALWPDEQQLEVHGVAVDSGVPEQPLSEQQTIMGARNRALRLREMDAADYNVGIEGGLCWGDNWWMECGWVVIISRWEVEGIAASPKIMIPWSGRDMIDQGADLNDVCSALFGVEQAGAKMGYFGLMTNGVVDRQRAYFDAVTFAAARFLHPHLFR